MDTKTTLESTEDEYTIDDARALFPNPAPLCDVPQPLPRPVAIPQISPLFDSPFVRAYPQIAPSGIDADEWCRFLDGLSLAMIGSPPLQVVALVGKVCGFVPSIAATVAAVVLQVGAGFGSLILSKSLTEKYLTYTNETFFAPRGLRVRICNTAAMRQLVGLDDGEPVPISKVAYAGKVAEAIALKLPIIGKGISRFKVPTVTPIDPNSSSSLLERRLAPIEHLVMPLSYDVPPPAAPAGLMDKTSNLAVKLRKHQVGSAEDKAMTQRRLLAYQNGTLDPALAASTSRQGKLSGMVQAGKAVFGEGDGTPVASGSSGGGFGTGGRRERKGGRRKQRRMARKVTSADREEQLGTQRLLWLVVLNLTDDERIEGSAEADSDAPINLSEADFEAELDELNDEYDYEYEEEKEGMSGGV
ncbi:hypothetical protein RQP46_010098 [Phenoliferia psychrophenolica]